MPLHFQILPDTLPLAVESIGCDWQQPSLQRQVGYPYYHWLQTQTGLGEIFIAGQQILLHPGQGILLPPFVPHAYYPRGEWTTQFVAFNGTLKENLLTILGTPDYILAADSPRFAFSQWIKRLVADYEANQLDYLAASTNCYTFLLQLAQAHDHQTDQQHPLYLQFVAPTIQSITEHYGENITVATLARENFISSQYLTRLFKRFTGKSTQAFLLEFRLNKAKELLVNDPELKIKSVAEQTGFPTASRFAEMFKAKNGGTPKEFRRLHLTP